MDKLTRKHLEDYLAGTLPAREKKELELHLEQQPRKAMELTFYSESSKWFEALRAPENSKLGGDFYAQVMQRVNEQKTVPFWAFFLQRSFANRLALVGLTWMALLGSYLVNFKLDLSKPVPHVAESILNGDRTPKLNILLGADIDQNRNSMLAVLVVQD